MPFVQGYLRIRGLHPDQGLPPVSPGAPDQGLPGEGAGDPGYGYPESPVDPGYGIPLPPPGVWPPPVPAHPIVPAPPGTPPGAIWPPPRPAHPWNPPSGSQPGAPSHPIQPVPPGPDQGLPGLSPGAPDQTLPDDLPYPSHPIWEGPQNLWVIVLIPGYGWSYVCIDPSLHPAHPMDPAATPK